MLKALAALKTVAPCLQVSTTFPSEWIRRKRRDGFYVTVMGCIGSATDYHWVVVTTSGTDYTGQAIELDFVYPSEAIHHYWDESAPPVCPPASGFSHHMLDSELFASAAWPCHKYATEHLMLHASARWSVYTACPEPEYAAGHRITVVACSPDQTAVALTQGAAFANREECPQETLRTSGFPARHIKVL